MDTTQAIQQITGGAVHSEPDITLLAICLVIGAASHFIKKAKRLQLQNGFDAEEFWKAEVFSIAMSLLACIGVMICKENIAELKLGGYVLGGYMYPTFIVLGYVSDSLIDWLVGGYEKKLKGKK